MTTFDRSDKTFMDYNRLREIRRFRKIKIQDLSKEVGIHRATLSRIERGLCNPSMETMEKIVSALNIRWEMFI